jgi:DNA-binding transcriptional regulator YiaG
MTTSGASREAADERREAAAEPVSAIPDDERALQEEIDRTREQLGLTAGQLAAKADVKAQAQAKWTRATERAKGAAAAASTVRDRLQATFAPVWKNTPETVRQTVSSGASTAKQRRTPLAAAAALLVAGLLMLRRWRKR